MDTEVRENRGQVRGLRQMIENDRYSVDAMSREARFRLPLGKLALLLISQHLKAGIPSVVENGGVNAPLAEEIFVILRSATSHPAEA